MTASMAKMCLYKPAGDKTVVYTTTTKGAYVGTSPIENEVTIDTLTSPLPPMENAYFTLTYNMTSPGIILHFKKAVHMLSDLINGWNMCAIQNGHEEQHIVMRPISVSSSYQKTHVHVQNTSKYTIHVFAFTHGYVGCWSPYEEKQVPINSFTKAVGMTNTTTVVNGPIVVMQDRPVFKMTAYIYKKTSTTVCVITENVVLRAGFYPNITALIAILNMNITMRGERNGYIYQFVQGKTSRAMTMGVEAAHRQHEPSFLLIEPVSSLLGAWEGEALTLHLRTSKRCMFECPVAHVMM